MKGILEQMRVQVFDFIRCSEDKEELFKLVQGDESFQCMEEDAYEVARSYVEAEEWIKVKNEYRGKDDEAIMELTGCSMEMLWETKQSIKK